MYKRKIFKPADVIIIAAVLLIAVLGALKLLCASRDNLVAVIRVNSKVYQTIELSKVKEPYTLEINGDLEVHLRIEKNCVYFSDSQCSDKICINTGKLTRSGQSAVCLPAGVSVSVTGTKNEMDGVAG